MQSFKNVAARGTRSDLFEMLAELKMRIMSRTVIQSYRVSYLITCVSSSDLSTV